MQDFNWVSDDSNGYLAERAIQYLEGCPPEIVPAVAMERLKQEDIDNGRDINRLISTRNFGIQNQRMR